jgi:hypothetical protein
MTVITISDAARLSVVIRDTIESFEVVEELASLNSLFGTTRGEDTILSMSETMKELDLPWTKLKDVTTDGDRSMSG